MKRKADILIGQRFVDELYRLFPEYSDRKIAKILGCGKSIILEWKDVRTPNGMFLASAMELGCDIEYVLTPCIPVTRSHRWSFLPVCGHRWSWWSIWNIPSGETTDSGVQADDRTL